MKLFLPLLAAAFVLSCSTKQPEAKLPAAGTPVTPTANDSIPFPVYLTFKEFEPHLLHSNDTAYVLNFWATWCKPCVAELPLFEKLIPAYLGRPVKIVLVSMDFPKDIERKLIPFVRERKLENHVVALADMDYNAWIDKVSTEWDGAIPFTLIYRAGNRSVKAGELSSYEELEALVEARLK